MSRAYGLLTNKGDALNEFAKERKTRKRAEALERQEKYDALSLEQQIALQEPFQGKQYRRLVAASESLAA